MKNIIIMGSGRSGTSMVAGCFANSGYFMGDDLWNACESNPKGFFEDREINEINEDLIKPYIPKRFYFLGKVFFQHRPVKWQRWLACLPPDFKAAYCPVVSERIRKIVRRQPYCFKDPRFSYTLSVWNFFLENTVFICVFRDPGSTAHSINKECLNRWYLANPKTGIKISTKQALKIWAHMYLPILLTYRHRGDWLFLHYNQVLTGKGMDQLEEFTGVMIDRSFPSPNLKRSKSIEGVPVSYMRIYKELCDLAGYDDPERFS